ncbi:transporter substrate-binding domain-containing protein [Reinekea sp.]|uniref:substrate-binding periplasmic protein n=1 Tax=Reinekea sp. TaxID=1970455 RepID=UPI002A81782B|nr:transporter substrate-binding domain-containing protein [Reinekea sp.]
MKIKFLRLLVLLLLSSISFSAPAVKMAIGDWAPYVSKIDPQSQLLETVVTAAFKLEGLTVEYEYLPWKRSFTNTSEGKADGTFPWNKDEERAVEFYIHEIPLLTDEGVYFHLKGSSFDWNTLSDLKNYKVGATIGFRQVEIYEKAGIAAEAVADEDINFKKIEAGRIDVYDTSKVVGYSTIKRVFDADTAAKFTHHRKPVSTNPYFILFSRNSENGQEYSMKFDSGMKKLMDSGEYDKIIKSFLGEIN